MGGGCDKALAPGQDVDGIEQRIRQVQAVGVRDGILGTLMATQPIQEFIYLACDLLPDGQGRVGIEQASFRPLGHLVTQRFAPKEHGPGLARLPVGERQRAQLEGDLDLALAGEVRGAKLLPNSLVHVKAQPGFHLV